MQDNTAARRYAEALSRLEDVDPEELERELASVSEIFQNESDIFEFFISPMISSENKKKVIRKCFETYVSDIVLNLLLFLIDKKRESEFMRIQEKLISQNDQNLGRVRVELVTARDILNPMETHVKKELITFIHKHYKKFGIGNIKKESEVLFHVRSDISVIGGVKIRVGDQYLDASVAHYLGRWKKNILSEKMSKELFWSET